MPRLDLRRVHTLPGVLVLVMLVACSQAPAKNAGSVHRLSAEGRDNVLVAQGYLEQHKDARAMEHVRLALQTDPDAVEVHVVMAMIQEADGELAKAGKSFDRALKLAPASGAVLNAHAAWLCRQDKVDAADPEFARALRDPDYRTPIEALANAGKCALKARRWAKAEQYFRQALEYSPEDRQLLFMLADTELRQGQTLEARAFIQRRDALGADAATLELAAKIEDAAGDRVSAARLRQRLGDEFPEHVPAVEGAATP